MGLIGSAAAWQASIKATLDTTDLSGPEIAILDAFWLGICEVHVTHITTNSLISTIVTTPDTINGTGAGVPPITGIL